MSNQSGSPHLQVLFETALQDYEKQTGIALDKHPLAEKLQIVTPSSPLMLSFVSKHKPSVNSGERTKY